MMLTGAIFDLGGVVLDSPMDAIARFERSAGLPAGTVNRLVAASGADGAWARHERGELGRDAFLAAFREEFATAGYHVDTERLLRRWTPRFVLGRVYSPRSTESGRPGYGWRR
ncbi:MAG: hypothetical protein ACLGHX_02685 [Acidimicrobiia bacterium]